MKRALSAWALALALTIPAALPASAGRKHGRQKWLQNSYNFGCGEAGKNFRVQYLHTEPRGGAHILFLAKKHGKNVKKCGQNLADFVFTKCFCKDIMYST